MPPGRELLPLVDAVPDVLPGDADELAGDAGLLVAADDPEVLVPADLLAAEEVEE
ncbi:hypothetical protein [Roseibium sp. LAB1]